MQIDRTLGPITEFRLLYEEGFVMVVSAQVADVMRLSGR